MCATRPALLPPYKEEKDAGYEEDDREGNRMGTVTMAMRWRRRTATGTMTAMKGGGEGGLRGDYGKDEEGELKSSGSGGN